MKNYYQILEVSPTASQNAIKEQYRFLLQAWHPDKFPNPDQKLKAEEKTKEINVAYEILGNPAKRAEYDRKRNAEWASTSSNETAGESKRRADEEMRKKEEENIRRKAEQAYADEVRRQQEEAKRRVDEEKKTKRRS